MEIGFTVSGYGEEWDSSGEASNAGEIFVGPLEFMGLLSSVGEVACVDDEVGSLIPDEFAECVIDVGARFGIGDDCEGEGLIFSDGRSEGEHAAIERSAVFVGGGDSVEVGCIKFEAVEGEVLWSAGVIEDLSSSECCGSSPFEHCLSWLAGFPDDGDSVGGGGLQDGSCEEVECVIAEQSGFCESCESIESGQDLGRRKGAIAYRDTADQIGWLHVRFVGEVAGEFDGAGRKRGEIGVVGGDLLPVDEESEFLLVGGQSQMIEVFFESLADGVLNDCLSVELDGSGAVVVGDGDDGGGGALEIRGSLRMGSIGECGCDGSIDMVEDPEVCIERIRHAIGRTCQDGAMCGLDTPKQDRGLIKLEIGNRCWGCGARDLRDISGALRESIIGEELPFLKSVLDGFGRRYWRSDPGDRKRTGEEQSADKFHAGILRTIDVGLSRPD